MALGQVKEGFRKKRGFPNCCGAIDVTHIPIRLPPNECSSDWYDRDHNYSMALQVIVDSNMHFMDVFTGWPGSVNDSRLLRNSAFYRMCEGGERLNGLSVPIGLLNMREYIIGDGGYPLLPWLITPFSGSVTTTQREFNFKLSSTCIVVECAFGRLKQLWWILESRMWHPNLEMLPKTILVCCILHNMVLTFVEDETDTCDDVAFEHENNIPTTEVGDPAATLARAALMEFVNGNANNVDMNLQTVTMCSLEKRGNVYILTLVGIDDHRFNPTTLDAISDALKVVEQSPDAAALVTTNAGKFFSNGLDLQWIAEEPASRLDIIRLKFENLLASFMRLGVPTLAAICGHAAAGGFMLALAHDYRFMTQGRSVLYMSELDHGMHIPRSLMAVIRSKLQPAVLRDVVLGAQKLTAQMALQRGILDGVCEDPAATLEAAVMAAEKVAGRGWKRDVYCGLRLGAFPGVVEELDAHRDSYRLYPSKL
ncbi:hypothetical protein KI387_038839 [Taxus chinensis]|uniref:Delta(3)-Delta(2)-enoyl-CoA isomerase n=1 Tax=Taxus chinensis TaxID=29808 RepID=A0AA38C643_TAXCH|nr:hypothetical protein KI387_038839 [Taxus chinensis]